MKNEAEARSAAARKGHQIRIDTVAGKEWEEGSDFKQRRLNSLSDQTKKIMIMR